MRNYKEEKLLNILCDKYGSDKGSVFGYNDVYNRPSHNYTKIYSSIFAPIKEGVKNVFECGLGTYNPQYKSNMGPNGKPGASHRVWRDYFQSATIYGADIDKDVLFSEDRIVTGYMDQTNKESIERFFKDHNIPDLDIAIDDGLHEFSAGISLYENVFPLVKNGGIYIIEDILEEDIKEYKNYFIQSSQDVMIVSLSRPNVFGWSDNTMIIIFKH